MKNAGLFLTGLAAAFSCVAKDWDGVLEAGGVQRTYHVHAPDHLNPAKFYPLVIVLHGGGGTGNNMIRLTQFNELADRDSFLVVYPDGLKNQWNDGRQGSDLHFEQDDVKFISMLIRYLALHHRINPEHVFVTGISNGAIFSLLLASRLPDQICAIAPVCGSIPANLVSEFLFSKKVSVLVVNGTADHLVPYAGGPVGRKGDDRGQVLATDSMIKLLKQQLLCNDTYSIFEFPDVSLKDQCTAKKWIWNCGDGAALHLITVDGGGHTWPGGRQYLPRFIVGNVCRDLNGTAEIWNFFASRIRLDQKR